MICCGSQTSGRETDDIAARPVQQPGAVHKGTMRRTFSVVLGAVFVFLVTASSLLFLASVVHDLVKGELYVWTTLGGSDVIVHWSSEPMKFAFHAVGKTAIALALLACVPIMFRQLLTKIRDKSP